MLVRRGFRKPVCYGNLSFRVGSGRATNVNASTLRRQPRPIFLLAGLTARQYCSSCTPMFRQLGYRLSYLQVLDNLVSLGIYNHLVAIWVANLRVQDFNFS